MPTREEVSDSCFYRQNKAIISSMIEAGDLDIILLIECHIGRKMAVKALTKEGASYEELDKAKKLKLLAKEKVIARILDFRQRQSLVA